METSTSKFSDYVTSGAFNMSLTRKQISSLCMIADNGQQYVDRFEALERKGLIEAIANSNTRFNEDGLEWRLTAAGCLAVELISLAGLSNAGANAKTVEIENLRRELDRARKTAVQAEARAWSMRAKYDWLTEKVRNYLRNKSGDNLILQLRARDKYPEVCVSCLMDYHRDISEHKE